MPAAKTSAKGGGRAKAAAARAETNGAKPKTITFREVELELPDELGCEVAYAFADLEEAGERIKPIIDFIISLIGPDQMEKVKARQQADGVTFMDLPDDLMKLVGDVYGAYGTEPGESSASQTP